jgi:predicted DNA-binding protein (MmcQ/YjbR family)
MSVTGETGMALTFETIRDYCLQKKGTTAEHPFGPETMVFKVMGKMFALCSPGNTPLAINLKCDPELAITLRSHYAAVQPGYHMNKEHWNTVTLDGSLPDDEVLGMIDHSYELVVKGLRKADRASLARQT